MLADDPRHGSTRGYAQGCRLDCCREAQNTYERNRRKRRNILGITRSIPALGTQRRIRALMALGWTSGDIANRCGWTTPQAVTVLLSGRRYVYRSTAEKIAAVYDQLSMTPGPSTRNWREAARKGWPPPLAWDNIDDPDERPRGIRTDTRRDLLAEWADLRAAGESIEQAAARLGVTVGAIVRAEFRAKRKAVA